MTNDVAEALDSLLEHPGWLYLTQHARTEFAHRERAGHLNALKDADDLRALNKLRQIAAAQEAIEWVLNWPIEERARLKRQEAQPSERTMSRRGSL